jgi:CRP-like cAMP-binding protein/predicted acylesterase/phospholipase RssA
MASPAEECVAFLQGTDVFGGLPAEDLSFLARSLTEVALEDGQVLFRQGEAADAMYVIREGRLIVFVEDKGQPRALTMLQAGRCVGEGALIMAGGRSASVRADAPSRLLRLPTTAFEAAVAAHPSLRRVLSALVAERLPGLIDASLRSDVRTELSWKRLARGEALFRAGDPGDAVYVLARGRLGAYRERPGAEEELVAEIGHGEPVGELALLTKEPRVLTVKALRDSDLVRLSAEGFETALVRNPQALVPLVRTMAQRLRAATAASTTHGGIHTIAVLPLGPGVAVAPLLQALDTGLRQDGATVLLGAEEVDAIHGSGASAASANSAAALHLTEWLNTVEGGHDYTIYRCHPAPTAWTRTCVGRADRVLVVASGVERPDLGALEALVSDAGSPPRELVLLHPDGRRRPAGTAAWLAAVRPVRHHHVRLDHPDDAFRVARFMAHRAVGVVMSGGGVRAFAHASILRVLRERGVAIDFLGGVSVGTLAPATFAMGFTHEEVVRALRAIIVAPGQPVKPYTLPVVSLFSTRRGERALQGVFGDTGIEDLWINYFCVASDITRGELRVLREGPVWRAMRASGAFPGLFPPIPDGGNVLVDGGLFRNLPVDVMRDLCPGPVIASDVSKERELEVDPALTTSPHPLRVLWDRVRGSRGAPFPTLTSILMRSIEAREASDRAELRKSAAFCFMPPVAQFAIDELDSMEEVVAIAYEYATRKVEEVPPSIARAGGVRPASSPS